MTNDTPAPRAVLCPICGKPAARAHRPFCSPRCRNVDLGRWLRGIYRVETDEAAADSTADDR